MLTIERSASPNDAAKHAGIFLGQQFQQYSDAILLLVSGGSALKILDFIDQKVLPKAMTIGVLDERFTRFTTINNFVQFTITGLYKKAKDRGLFFIDTLPLENESFEAFAHRFEKALRTWRAVNPEGNIIITQGIGPDGHTAGIFPFPEDPKTFDALFNNPDHWVVGYDAGAKNPYSLRATVTLPFLRSVDVSIMYACGAVKQDALVHTLAKTGILAETPARIIHEMKHVRLFTDIAGLR